MEAQIGKGMSPEDRYNLLHSNKDDIEKVKYRLNFSVVELEELSSLFIDQSKAFEELDEEKKKLVSTINAKMKVLRASKKDLLGKLLDKGEDVSEDCFKFIDHEEGVVGYYSSDGFLVHVRKIKPAERQTSAFGSIKALKKAE